MARRDPAFVGRVQRLVAEESVASEHLSDDGAPHRLPLRLGTLTSATRVFAVDRVEAATGEAHLAPVGARFRGPGDCLVTNPAGHVAAYRGAGVGAVGVAVDTDAQVRWDDPPDFVVVSIGERGQRVERTRAAERLRNEHRCTVLLRTPAITNDEMDTLIAAGRIDGCVVVRPGAPR